MQNKPNAKNRDDIKVIITAIALTLTLGFWNLFSDGAQKPIQAASLEPSVPQAAQVKILLGGPAPKTTIIVSQPHASQQRIQQSAPQPVANTASSK